MTAAIIAGYGRAEKGREVGSMHNAEGQVTYLLQLPRSARGPVLNYVSAKKMFNIRFSAYSCRSPSAGFTQAALIDW